MRRERAAALRVKRANSQVGWVRRDLVRRDDGCLPDRREVLLTPPTLHMSDGSGAPGPKGKVVVEADVDETGAVKAVRVVTNETGSAERAERRNAKFRASGSSLGQEVPGHGLHVRLRADVLRAGSTAR